MGEYLHASFDADTQHAVDATVTKTPFLAAEFAPLSRSLADCCNVQKTKKIILKKN
jgi:hypothetical protein